MNINGIFSKRGFTLIEVIITLGLIAILAAIVIVAINPGRQFAQGRNTQRSSDLNAILNSVYQYAADNNGALPPSVAALTEGGAAQTICRTGGTCGGGQVNLSPEVVPTYIVQMPVDPEETNVNLSGYTIGRLTGGRVRVNAPLTDIPPAVAVLSVTR